MRSAGYQRRAFLFPDSRKGSDVFSLYWTAKHPTAKYTGNLHYFIARAAAALSVRFPPASKSLTVGKTKRT